MKTVKAKKIVLYIGGREELAKRTGAHINTIDAALRFQSNSNLQKEIRKEAFKMGGKVKSVEL